MGTGDNAVKRTSLPLELRVSTTAGTPQEIYNFTDKWSIESEDPAHVLKPTEFGFRTTYSSGGLYQAQQGKNILIGQVIDANNSDDLEITVKQRGLTSSSWSDTGAYLYKDQNNYIAIQRKHRSGDTRKIAQVKESLAKAQETWYGGDENVRDGENAESVIMKFTKKGNSVTTYFSFDDGNDWHKIGEADAQFLGKDLKLAFASGSSSDADGNNTPVSYTDITINGKKIKIGEKKTVDSITPSGNIPVAKNSQARITGEISGLLDGKIVIEPNVFNYASTTDAGHSLINTSFKTSAKASMRLQLNNKDVKPSADGVFNSIQLAPGTNILKADVIAEDGVTHSVYRWAVLNTDTQAISVPTTPEKPGDPDKPSDPEKPSDPDKPVVPRPDDPSGSDTPPGNNHSGDNAGNNSSADNAPEKIPPADAPSVNTPDKDASNKDTPKGSNFGQTHSSDAADSQNRKARQTKEENASKDSKDKVGRLPKTGAQNVCILALASLILVSGGVAGGAIIFSQRRHGWKCGN